MVLLPIEKVPSCISTTWYLYLMVLLPSIQVKLAPLRLAGANFWPNRLRG